MNCPVWISSLVKFKVYSIVHDTIKFLWLISYTDFDSLGVGELGLVCLNIFILGRSYFDVSHLLVLLCRKKTVHPTGFLAKKSCWRVRCQNWKRWYWVLQAPEVSNFPKQKWLQRPSYRHNGPIFQPFIDILDTILEVILEYVDWGTCSWTGSISDYYPCIIKFRDDSGLRKIVPKPGWSSATSQCGSVFCNTDRKCMKVVLFIGVEMVVSFVCHC